MSIKLRDFRYYLRKHESYSQHGEDMVLKSYFENQSTGFFVDIGAHHPFRFSNTYYFYKKGWRGINVDPKPGTKQLFDFFRSRDINLELGVAQEESSLTYYMFDEPALNSFSKDLSESRDSNTIFHIIGTQEVPVIPLKQILEKHVPANTRIDFLTVDVEGLDLEVLASNDWEKFRPSFIIAEDLDFKFEKPTESDIYNYLAGVGYQLSGKTLASLIFKAEMA
jgi:FkbM family methyltransferase